jgi:hypothetical protein
MKSKLRYVNHNIAIECIYTLVKKVQENAQSDLIGVQNSTLPVVMIADLIAAGLQLG